MAFSLYELYIGLTDFAVSPSSYEYDIMQGFFGVLHHYSNLSTNDLGLVPCYYCLLMKCEYCRKNKQNFSHQFQESLIFDGLTL